MHGCGNDFVIVDGPVELTVARVRELCDRRCRIGADGVLVMGAARGILRKRRALCGALSPRSSRR
jgi:diaminopimelate epimerase